LAEPVQLSEGDILWVTRGQYHTLRDQPSTPTVDFDLAQAMAASRRGGQYFGAEGPITRIVCGNMFLQNHKLDPLLAILPPLLHGRRSAYGLQQLLWPAIDHIRSEVDSRRVGAKEVLTRVADVLLIRALRAYFREKVEPGEGRWLAAVRDHQIGQALAVLHTYPNGKWTVDSLAQRFAMSRSNFATRFKELVGEPPQRYLTRVRINIAATRLRSSADKVDKIAAAGGYRSVASFSRSFKKHTGMSPVAVEPPVD
jgi:AraC-like DNA-binding protein